MSMGPVNPASCSWVVGMRSMAQEAAPGLRHACPWPSVLMGFFCCAQDKAEHFKRLKRGREWGAMLGVDQEQQQAATAAVSGKTKLKEATCKSRKAGNRFAGCQ